MPMPQPRCSAGNSSITITYAVAEHETMKVRDTIWSPTNCQTLCANAVSAVATESPISDARNRRRRPMRSANGMIRKAATAPPCTKPSIPPMRDSATPRLSEICLSAAVSIDWS